MAGDRKNSRFTRFERDALMEWILVRQRLILLLVLALGIALTIAVGLLYSVGVSGLNKKELRHFAHQQRLYPRNPNQGPIFEKVPPE